MISFKNLLCEVKYEFGCLMAVVPENVAPLILNFGKEIISDDMLYFSPAEPDDYGRDDEPHVTIKFGFTQPYTNDQISQILQGTKPFDIFITGMDVFENPSFDVVKLNVEGEELRRLRAIADQLPNEDKYKDYHPHMTLAYVKPGLGKKFKGRKTRAFSRIPITKMKYSDSSRRAYFQL